MDNQIMVRTNKGEFLPGQTIYGAVYLHVCRPTEANGIAISFRGIERCHYQDLNHENTRFENTVAHVDFSDVRLYSQTGCFEFGSYVFPFQFDLPKEIPGTFNCSGRSTKACWLASANYKLDAKAIGADILQTSQPVVIYQAQEQALKDSHCGAASTVAYQVSRLFLAQKKIHITAKLLESYKTTGSNMQLRLIVTNPTNLRVIRFKILLLRYLKLFVCDETAQSKLVKSQGHLECQDDIVFIAPEEGPCVVYLREGDLSSFPVQHLELDQLQIPLKEKVEGESTETNLPASVVGKHVKNQYQLELTVTFDNNHTQVLHLPIPGVLPESNRQWLHWTPPEWTFHSEVMTYKSPLSVLETTLRTEAFSGLPTFQVL